MKDLELRYIKTVDGQLEMQEEHGWHLLQLDPKKT